MLNKNKINKSITIEDVEKALSELSLEDTSKTRHVIFYTGCKTYGSVKRDTREIEMIICNDITCTNCQMMNNALKEAAKNYLDGK